MFGTYIHIPFCDKLCIYCDFAKEIAKTPKKRAYLEALFFEMEASKEYLLHTDTVYIGGGTPTALEDEDFERLLQEIHRFVTMDTVQEFTIEANPKTMSASKAQLFKAYGVTRVSLGVQSFDPVILNTIGRDHTKEDVLTALSVLKDAGIDNVSLDIMFGLPGQTLAGFKTDLAEFIHVNAAHYSIYALILEDHTPLMHKLNHGLLTLPDDDTVADMFETVIAQLKNAGYEQYEISTFAKPDKRSLHNQIYWRNEPYIGLGAGAHGRIETTRYENIRSVKKYTEAMLENGLKARIPYLYQPIHDTLLMGLRMTEGIDLKAFKARHQVDPFERFKGLVQKQLEGFITVEDGFLKLTEKGIFFANEVLVEFIDDHPTPEGI